MFNQKYAAPRFTAASHTTSDPTATQTPPKPAPRRKKTPPSGISPMPSIVEEKPRRNSYSGEDSLKLYDLAVTVTPPSKVHTQPVAKPRRAKGTSDNANPPGGSEMSKSHTLGPPWASSGSGPSSFQIMDLDVHESLAGQYINRPLVRMALCNYIQYMICYVLSSCTSVK